MVERADITAALTVHTSPITSPATRVGLATDAATCTIFDTAGQVDHLPQLARERLTMSCPC